MMTSLNCTRTQSSFSAYLDGAVSGHQMQAIARHLDACDDCSREFASLRTMQQSLAMLGPAKAPADLGMKLASPSRTSAPQENQAGSTASA